MILKEARVLHGPWRRGEVTQKMGTITVENCRHGRTRSEQSHVGSTQRIVLAVATAYYMNCCPITIIFLLAFWVRVMMMVIIIIIIIIFIELQLGFRPVAVVLNTYTST